VNVSTVEPSAIASMIPFSLLSRVQVTMLSLPDEAITFRSASS